MQHNNGSLLPLGFDLQLFADEGGEGEAGNGDDQTNTGEQKDTQDVKDSKDIKDRKDTKLEFYEMEDPETREKIKVPLYLKTLIGHVMSTERKIAKKKLDDQYKPLMEEAEKIKGVNADLASKLEELKMASMTAEEKAQAKIEKQIKSYEIQAEKDKLEVDKWKNQFFQNKILTDIYGSFGDTKLCNSKQTAFIFMNEGNATVEEELESNNKHTGKYKTVMKLVLPNEHGELEEMIGTPKELFPKWIVKNENLHHIENSLVSGGGSTSGKVKGNVSELVQMNPVERMKFARTKAI